MDTACIAALSTNKTQVIGDSLIYTVSGDVVHADLDDEFRLFADVDPIMGSNDYYGRRNLIGNMGFQSLIARNAEHAKYNDANQEIHLQNKTIRYTNRIANAANKSATFYAVNEGSVGLLYRFEAEALLATRARTGHEWNLDRLIGLDIPVSTYYYEGVASHTADHGDATAHATRVMKQYYGFSVDVAYVVAYNSDQANIASPILACDIADT